MEKFSTKIAKAVDELTYTINSAVAELKDNIKENLSLLSNVKKNIEYAYNEMDDIFHIARELNEKTEEIMEETDKAVDTLEDVLAVIMPETYGEIDDDDDNYIVVEDTETGEETEHPIN